MRQELHPWWRWLIVQSERKRQWGNPCATKKDLRIKGNPVTTSHHIQITCLSLGKKRMPLRLKKKKKKTGKAVLILSLFQRVLIQKNSSNSNLRKNSVVYVILGKKEYKFHQWKKKKHQENAIMTWRKIVPFST